MLSLTYEDAVRQEIENILSTLHTSNGLLTPLRPNQCSFIYSFVFKREKHIFFLLFYM